MNKLTRLISCAFAMILFFSFTAFGDIPPEQEVVIVEPGAGVLESTINRDTLPDGSRANPQRVYQLQAGGLYLLESPILFSGGGDPDATLTIVAEEGGKKALVIMNPRDGGDAFRNQIAGSLTLRNLYWPGMALNGSAAGPFNMSGGDIRVELDGLFAENQVRQDYMSTGGVTGALSLFITNSYFRDHSRFANPWNFAIVSRPAGGAIDTIWVENVTVANGGLLFLNPEVPIKFGFFHQNTFQNVPRYWNMFEQYKEVYFTNNIFINALWHGEAPEMMLSQLTSQKRVGPHPVGVINLMEPEEEMWLNTYIGEDPPTIDDVRFFASNNLTFTSPYLDNYYSGAYNDLFDAPVSYIDWGFSAGADLPLPPHEVVNVPVRFFSHITEALIEEHPHIVATNNHDQVDPGMVTNIIRDQAHGDLMAQWARNNYAVEGVEMPARELLSIGDLDPTTIPGPEGEDGSGISNVREMPEDFTYAADIISEINGRRLGAQEWYGDISDWDSRAELAQVIAFYEALLGDDDDPPVVPDVTVWTNETGSGLWSDAGNWSEGLPGDITRVIFNVEGAGECVLDIEATIQQFVLGDGGGGDCVLRIADGGSLTTGLVWSGIAWSTDATLIVERGGTLTFGQHMWAGWNGDSEVEIHGTVNVSQMYGTAFEGQAGSTYTAVRDGGVLNLANMHAERSIPEGSVLDVSGSGVIYITGDHYEKVNNYVELGRISANDGMDDPVVELIGTEEEENQVTIISVTGGVSVPEVVAPKALEIFPNPANNVLHINSGSEMNAVKIFDLTGRMVRHIDMGGAFNSSVNISDMQVGFYIIQVEDLNGAVSSSRFVKR